MSCVVVTTFPQVKISLSVETEVNEFTVEVDGIQAQVFPRGCEEKYRYRSFYLIKICSQLDVCFHV